MHRGQSWNNLACVSFKNSNALAMLFPLLNRRSISISNNVMKNAWNLNDVTFWNWRTFGSLFHLKHGHFAIRFSWNVFIELRDVIDFFPVFYWTLDTWLPQLFTMFVTIEGLFVEVGQVIVGTSFGCSAAFLKSEMASKRCQDIANIDICSVIG